MGILGDDVPFDHARLRRHAEALGTELTVGPGNVWPKHRNISTISFLQNCVAKTVKASGRSYEPYRTASFAFGSG
jgi:hypothetical protein